jgi:hypothetical protein
MPNLEYERQLKEKDIIQGVKVIGKEDSKSQEVYVFRLKLFPDVKGLIFPNDDVISLGDCHDIIVNKISDKTTGRIILSEIYHEYQEIINKTFLVKISDISSRGNPMFKLYGYRGFIVEGDAKIGEKVAVKTIRICGKNNLEKMLYIKVIGHIQ